MKQNFNVGKKLVIPQKGNFKKIHFDTLTLIFDRSIRTESPKETLIIVPNIH